jgi:predicted dehydrogenase
VNGQLRTALFGCGRIGAGYADDPVMARHYRYTTHAQVLRDHPGFSFVAAIDRNEIAARAVQQRFAADRACTQINELAPDEIDVAVLATPPGERIDIVQRLPRLRAVVVEKPIGASLDEATAFVGLCAKRNIVVQVALPRRVDKSHRALASGLLAEWVGPVQGAFLVYGNGLLNNATHMVDLARMLIGEVSEVHVPAGLASYREGPIADDINVPFTLRMVDGIPVMALPLAFTHYRENAIDLWGERGRLAIVQEGLRFVRHARTDNRAMSGERELINDAGMAETTTIGEAFYDLYDDLHGALADNRIPGSSGESALRTMAATAAIRRSADSGRPEKP